MKTIVIILGAARSGSTLVAKAIGSHSLCFTLGEINRFNEEINKPETLCGCGEKLNECNFWINILMELNLDFDDFPKNNSKFRMRIQNQITKKNRLHKLISMILFRKKYNNKIIGDEINNTFTLYENIFTKTNAEVLIDSTKGLFRALILQSMAPQNIKFQFIQLTRDGRGVLNSSLKSSYSVMHNDGVLREYSGVKNKNYKKLIDTWSYINIRNFIILKLFRKKDCFFMKYEDFTDNPEHELKTIFDKLKLSYEESALNLGYHKNHILGGNSSRINAKKIKKQDDAWRRNLDKNLLNKFNKRAGWLNKLLGYR